MTLASYLEPPASPAGSEKAFQYLPSREDDQADLQMITATEPD
jgi:hypothetical protein